MRRRKSVAIAFITLNLTCLVWAQEGFDGAMRSRPLCPYPAIATYKDEGSDAAASSFVCQPS